MLIASMDVANVFQDTKEIHSENAESKIAAMVFSAPRMLTVRTVIAVAILATLETALANVITKIHPTAMADVVAKMQLYTITPKYKLLSSPLAPRPELCGNIYCHEKARCHSGTCYCEYGYAGDGVTVCEKVEEDLCKRVQCAENAECEAGLCQCKPGYKGDGFSECTPMEVDPSSCNGRYCGANAECRDGVCMCVPDYTGDPYDICTRKRPLPASCVGIRCGANAYCRGGRCVCPQGYVGDANQVCYPVWDGVGTDCQPQGSLGKCFLRWLKNKVLRVLMLVITLRATRTQPVPKGSVNATTASKETASSTAGLRILV
ncbi:Tenascin-X, partial [Taenia solium]